MSYADIHCHILPGVDDGSRSLDESLGYARRLVGEGVGEVVATPHIGHPILGADPEELPERAATLVEALDGEGIPLRIHIGGELFPHGNADLPDEVLELVSHGPDGARWLLMEVPFAGIDKQFVEDARTLMARGYGLVIAHPERANGLLDGGWELLAPLVAAGALLQVNVCSLLGNNGRQARLTGEALVRGGHAFALASDAHPGTREHTLALGFPLAVRAGASSTQAWRLTQANPRFLLESGIPQGPAALPFGPPVVAS